ncbi:MAG: zf-HC2 domain-containing protein [Ruminococcus sp.]|nr:zf-HC2 domain-containing protein [Ruminococcus sp.]
MNNNCGIIKDLLPLYADGVCSEESRKAVEEHIAGCSECRSELENINKDIAVPAVKDAGAVKRIKRRIRTEKIVAGLAAGAVILGGLSFLAVWLINTDRSMDMEKYHITENVTVTEHDGALWLNVKGTASSFSLVYPTLSDTDGDHFGYGKGFEKEKKNGMGYTLKQRRIDSFAFTEMGSAEPFERKIKDISELDESIRKIFYYDDVNNKEYILWERD